MSKKGKSTLHLLQIGRQPVNSLVDTHCALLELVAYVLTIV